MSKKPQKAKEDPVATHGLAASIKKPEGAKRRVAEVCRYSDGRYSLCLLTEYEGVEEPIITRIVLHQQTLLLISDLLYGFLHNMEAYRVIPAAEGTSTVTKDKQ